MVHIKKAMPTIAATYDNNVPVGIKKATKGKPYNKAICDILFFAIPPDEYTRQYRREL